MLIISVRILFAPEFSVLYNLKVNSSDSMHLIFIQVENLIKSNHSHPLFYECDVNHQIVAYV